MALIDEETINEVREKANIADVISHYVPLTQKGKSLWCTCPFHDDHSPSMSVSTQKQIYKCFVCNEGGNVFQFVSKIENIPFPQAVVKVAQLCNIDINIKLDDHSVPKDPYKEKLYDLLKISAQYLNYNLLSSDCTNVVEYLKSRGINEKLINKFCLGYNSTGNNLHKYLTAKKYDTSLMLDADLIKSSSNEYIDVFKNRITIPIQDINGNYVGFSARIFNGLDDEPKYINTSSTKVYDKGNLIYNYHIAKTSCKKDGYVYLLEGAMDVISLAKIDIDSAIANLGTACSNQQLSLIKRLHTTVRVFYDGDTAGKNATYKFGKLASEQQIPFEIVNNPYAYDPDEIIEKYGKDELKEICKNTRSWIDFLFAYLNDKYDIKNYSDKKEFTNELVSEISKLDSSFEKDSYFNKLYEITGFNVNRDKSNNKSYIKKRESLNVLAGRIRSQYEILSMILASKNASIKFQEDLGFLFDDSCNKLAYYILDYYRKNDKSNIAAILDYIKEDEVKKLLITISEYELYFEDFTMIHLKQVINSIRVEIIKQNIKELTNKANTISDPVKKGKIMDEILELVRQRNELFDEQFNDSKAISGG